MRRKATHNHRRRSNPAGDKPRHSQSPINGDEARESLRAECSWWSMVVEAFTIGLAIIRRIPDAGCQFLRRTGLIQPQAQQ